MRSNRKISAVTVNQWCVILNPIDSELSKAETIEKIIEIFPLTLEEASQLVERTPIILLENLSYDQAKKVKDFFSIVNADILLTDDTYLRRKCYRTVWPQDPLQKLNALGNPLTAVPHEEISLPKEKLSKESAIQGIREEHAATIEMQQSVLDREKIGTDTDTRRVSRQKDKEALVHEIEHLKKEIYTLKRNESLHAQTNNEFEYLSIELEKTKEALGEKDNAIKKLRHEFDDYQRLQKDTGGHEQREDESKKVHAALNEKVAHVEKLERENKQLHVSLRDAQRDNDELCRIQDAHNELQKKYDFLEGEIRDFAAKRSESEEMEKQYTLLAKKVAHSDKEFETFQETLKERDQEIKRLKDTLKSKYTDTEIDHKQLQSESKSLRSDVRRKKEMVDRLHTEKNQLKTLLKDLQRDNEELRTGKTNYEGLENKYTYLEEELKGYEQSKSLLEDLEEKYEELQGQLHEKGEELDVAEEVCKEKGKEVGKLKHLLEESTIVHNDARKRMNVQVRDLTNEVHIKNDLIKRLQEEKNELKSLLEDVKQDNEELRQVKVHYEDLESKYSYLEEKLKDFTHVKEQLKALEDTYTDACKKAEQHEDELTMTQSRLADMKSEYNDAREKFALLRIDFDKFRVEKDRLLREQDILITQQNNRIHDLDEKCKKLSEHNDMQQRTIKELTAQREQQETMEKRVKLQQDISLQELKYRELVHNQESCANEIIEREEKIKGILSKQEEIEKVLVKFKQEQKHLIEKAKIKVKQRIPKSSSSRVSFVSPDERNHDKESADKDDS